MSKQKFLEQNLRPGELYAGLILGKNGEADYHLFLLPGEAPPATWKKQLAWAKKQGGDLPNRREQPLLLANLKEEFKPEYYWSGVQHAALSLYAWAQHFNGGNQYDFTLSHEFRARAVRRVPIQ
jgi:hypothetical protein